MSRIFISHSSRDGFEAVAVRNWLATQGWDDVFLDLDPESGIVAGERWERALHEAANRCEAVIFLVSRNWLASLWCMKEYALARGLNKALFGIIVDEALSVATLPAELTGAWQVVSLVGGELELFRVRLPGNLEEKHVVYSKEGLRRLKRGLDKAGLDPRFFAWPPADEPGRAPYRGLRALDEADAGIFFGREAPVVMAIDRLRGLRVGAAPRLFVLLGASGAGKSSFLKAGLLPRLRRADLDFYALSPIRPERAALTGDNGLIGALERAFPSQPRAQLRGAIAGGATALRPLLRHLTVAASPAGDRDGGTRAPPTLVVTIDQAEELFRTEGAEESAALLTLLADLARGDDPAVIVAFAIRSDSYDRLEHAAALEGMPQATFPLLPLPRGNYKDVIEGPAARMRQAGRKLDVEPLLTSRLLEEVERGGGGDALPLLAFALEQLFAEFGASGALRLVDFEALGGLEGAIAKSVQRAFARADSDRRIPLDQGAREALLRRGLVPWLAGIDPATRSPRRNIALKRDIPEEARPLIELLVEERLLVADTHTRDGERFETIEPAHEALLRQWGLLRGWLADDLGLLTTLEGVRRSALDWDANGRADGWLAHRGGRLAEARALDVRPDLVAQFDARDHAYLSACSGREAAAAEERERARAAELARAKAEADRARAGQRFARNLLVIASVAALGLAALGAFAWQQRGAALEQSTLAEAQRTEADKQRANAEAAQKTADTQAALAKQEQQIAVNTLNSAIVRLAATDDELDTAQADRMRSCTQATERIASGPPPKPSRDFMVGRWHVVEGGATTSVDWRADGTCSPAMVIEAKSLFAGLTKPRDLASAKCTWRYSDLPDGKFAIDYDAPDLGDDYPKHLVFTVKSPIRIQNVDQPYSAIRIVCPEEEIQRLTVDIATLRQRLAEAPADRQLRLSLLFKILEMGISYLQQGKPSDAVKAYLEATNGLTILAEGTAPNSNENGFLAIWTFSLGEAQHEAGEEDAALQSFRRGLQLGEALVAAAPKNLLARKKLVAALIEFAGYAKGDEAAAALARARLLLTDIDNASPGDLQSHALRVALEAEAKKAPAPPTQTP